MCGRAAGNCRDYISNVPASVDYLVSFCQRTALTFADYKHNGRLRRVPRRVAWVPLLRAPSGATAAGHSDGDCTIAARGGWSMPAIASQTS